MRSNGAPSRVRTWMAMALAVAILLSGGAWFWMWSRLDARPADPVLQDYGTVPAFQLTERSGQRVTEGDLKGKIWVADFIFTRCGGSCLTMSSQMSELQKSLERAGDVRLVSFTVDPDYDTPQRLAAYAERYQAKGEKWLFLTGGEEQMQKLAKDGFHLPTTDAGTAVERVIHSTRFVLVDAVGHIRGYYSTEDREAKQKLLHDLGILLRQERS